MIHDKSITTEFKNRIDEMSRVAKDLQSGIMKTRMLPIGQVFSRFERLVRDLAHEGNKDIELIIKGEDTELDKKVIDSIGDPLIHLIRNAVDHGAETAEQRRQLGKPDEARVTLNAYQSGSQIFVEVADDGKGLDVEKIRKKAVDKGLIDPEVAAAMPEDKIFDFIFMPGFSTADKITDISGRGVGMNVVKETVMELNGNVVIHTEKDVGTTFQLEFPLTLAIISAVLTKIGDEIYAIPLSDIDETINIPYSAITTIEGHEVINLRGDVLSVLRLSRFVGKTSKLTKNEKIPIVVVGYANRKIGLMVDSLEGKMEIVIKSIEQNYRTVEGLAGASILGDGSICLILDVASMVNMAISDQNSYYSSRAIFDGETGKIDEQEAEEETVEETPPEAAPVKAESEGEEETAEAEAEEAEEEEEIVEEVKVRSVFDDVPEDDEEAAPEDEAVGESEGDAEPVAAGEEAETAEVLEKPEEPASTESVDSVEARSEDEGTANSVESKVQETLSEFRRELKQNIRDTLKDENHLEDIFPADAMKQLQLIANIGAAHAAESMSKIISKQVDLSIPDVSICPIESVAERTGCTDDQSYVGGIMDVDGTFGSILLLFNEPIAFELIDLLYGPSPRESGVLDEYCESILKEITNIVGSSLLNVIAERMKFVIQPQVPFLAHDTVSKILQTADVEKNSINGHVIIMDTAFFFENDNLLAHLILMPKSESADDFIRLIG
jgi:two-component system chemotaxis sensor kinase CheA